MSAETRVREAVRGYVDRLPVPAAPPLPLQSPQPPASNRRRLVPLAAAVGACLAIVAVALVPRLGGVLPLRPGQAPDGQATLPDRIARYSYLTADVSDDPPGRAIALYQHGFGVELLDFPQALVLGADDDVYRRLDVAERRGGPWSQGDPAPMLLAPDGARVAVGSGDGAGTRDLLLQDLRTGKVSTIACPAFADYAPVSWSTDGRYIAALTKPGQFRPQAGALTLFDVQERACSRLGGFADITMAAFSPDGNELAVQSAGLVVLDRASGVASRRLPVDSRYRLDSGAAWSPDGRLLAVHDPGAGNVPAKIAFVDATGRGSAVPAPIESSWPEPLGWTGPGGVVIHDARAVSSATDLLVQVDLDTGVRTTLSSIDTGPVNNYQVMRLTLAGTLMIDVRPREAGSPDRGPWPWKLRVLVLAVLAIVVLLVTRGARSFKRGTRTVKESGSTPVMSDTTDRSETTGPTSERDHDVGR